MPRERDPDPPRTSDGLQPALESLSELGHAVVGLDRTGRIVFWNQRAASLSGWAPATATGRLLYDLLVGRSRLELVDGLTALADGLSWQAAVDLEGPRGRTLRVELSVEPVLRDGTVEGGAGVLRVLSREAQDRRLHELSVALRTVPDVVLVVDHELRVTEWNPAAEELFGWSRVAMLGLTVTDIVPERDREAFGRMWVELVAGRVPAPHETTIIDRHGRPRMLTVHGAGYREQGRFAGAVATIHELSERQQDDRVLAGLVATIPVVVAAYDEQARVTLAAGGGCALPQVAAWAEVGADLLQALPTESDLRAAVVDSLAGRSTSVRVAFDERVWQCHVAPAEGGGTLSAVDVTAEQVLDERLQALFAAGHLGFVVFDASGRATYAAGSVLEDQGIDVLDLVGVPLLEVYAHEVEFAEALLRCLAGHAVDLVTERRSRVLEVHMRSYRDRAGRVTGGVCLVQDATAWAGGETPLPPDVAPQQDDVTGLMRHEGLLRLVAEPLARGATRAVAVLDVEAYSLVGETYGVDSAKLVMQVLAGRLARHCHPATVGRWAEDAFAIVLDAADARAALSALLDEALAALALPVELPTGRLHLSASVGAAVSDQVPTPDLLEAAAHALQRARAEGLLDVCWYSREMRPLRGGPRLLRQLSTALTNDELRVHYQPIVAIDTREPTAVEALIRWEHPTEGLLLPDAFVLAAERSDLVHDLGRWVATAACRQAVELREAGTPLKVAVNVAARQLAEPGLVEMLTEATEASGCPPSALSVEVTETAVMADLDAAVATLEQLKELGVELALDDFGTGYSSLLYLRRFPVDCLKIDRSFVAGLGVSPEDTAIVASTISLGHSVGVKCVAEGVETLAQLELLRSMGCDFAQGYLFSRAVPGDQLSRWLAEHSARSPKRGMWAVVPPPEAEEILRLHAEGASLHTIAAALNVAGRRTPRGTRWQARSVATVVANWAYPALGRDR